jgi:hypothetical protein
MEGTRAQFQHAAGDALDERSDQLLGRMSRAVRTSDCVLDGVVCSFDEGVVYVVVDLLELEGASLVDLPWSDRRKRLEGLLDDHVGEVRISRAYDDGPALRTAARGQGLGIVAKRRKSAYAAGEVSDDWRLLAP